MSHVWMCAMSIHASPWILHRIINNIIIYYLSMRRHQHLLQPPSMKLIVIQFFWGGKVGPYQFTILWKTSPPRSHLWCTWNLCFLLGDCIVLQRSLQGSLAFSTPPYVLNWSWKILIVAHIINCTVIKLLTIITTTKFMRGSLSHNLPSFLLTTANLLKWLAINQVDWDHRSPPLQQQGC